jgi:hypothetical protein
MERGGRDERPRRSDRPSSAAPAREERAASRPPTPQAAEDGDFGAFVD